MHHRPRHEQQRGRLRRYGNTPLPKCSGTGVVHSRRRAGADCVPLVRDWAWARILAALLALPTSCARRAGYRAAAMVNTPLRDEVRTCVSIPCHPASSISKQSWQLRAGRHGNVCLLRWCLLSRPSPNPDGRAADDNACTHYTQADTIRSKIGSA